MGRPQHLGGHVNGSLSHTTSSPIDGRQLGHDRNRIPYVVYPPPGHGGQILEAFSRRLEAAGGPAAALTYEPDSLVPVFSWAMERIRRVTGEVVDDGELPPWHVLGPITSGAGDFDPESARWADGLSRYYGEVLVRHLPRVTWAIADEPRYRAMYPDQWWPIVSGPLLAINPLEAGGLAAKQNPLPADQRDIDWLRRNYRRYLEVVMRDRDSEEGPEGWQVGEVDYEPALAEGWRYGVSGDEDEDLDEVRAEELTRRLRLLLGVTEVEREDRTAWLIAGEVSKDAIEAVARGWAREERIPAPRGRTKKRKS